MNAEFENLLNPNRSALLSLESVIIRQRVVLEDNLSFLTDDDEKNITTINTKLNDMFDIFQEMIVECERNLFNYRGQLHEDVAYLALLKKDCALIQKMFGEIAMTTKRMDTQSKKINANAVQTAFNNTNGSIFIDITEQIFTKRFKDKNVDLATWPDVGSRHDYFKILLSCIEIAHMLSDIERH